MCFPLMNEYKKRMVLNMAERMVFKFFESIVVYLLVSNNVIDNFEPSFLICGC